MFDYNLSNHWADDEPAWVKSLTSSLYRRHGECTVLPLPLVVHEIVNWVHLASGEDAWSNKQNRGSLAADLDQSAQSVGRTLRLLIDSNLKAFGHALARLDASPKALLRQPPGSRSATAWTDVLDSGADLLANLDSDAAVGACWDDLVDIAQDDTCTSRQHRPVADLLFAQLSNRGVDADQVLGQVVRMVAYGKADGVNTAGPIPAVNTRIASARAIAITPAETRSVVVWLGYKGRIHARLNAGRVAFYDAHWAVPNATSTGQDFDHKDELTELVTSGSLFKVAERVDEDSDVDTLVRVDLGQAHAAGATERAIEIVDSIFNVSLHFGGGIRPHLAQHALVWDGQPSAFGYRGSGPDTVLSDDYYGAALTADAVDEFGPKIADALAREQLPRFLSAAIEVQTASDRPFSRDLMLRQPSAADITSVVPLSDRVVQHVAAYAAISPTAAFKALGNRWAHNRWISNLHYAVSLCLVGGGNTTDLRDDLTREWYNPSQPSAMFIKDRKTDLLRVCRIESERGWIERMLSSVSDPTAYVELVAEYEQERRVLEARRARVRNALVHGNPAHFDVVTSVRTFSEFLSSSALHYGIEAYVSSSDPAAALNSTTPEYDAMQTGTSCVDYWRAYVRSTSTPSTHGS